MNQNLTFVHLTDLHVGDPNVPDDHLYSDTNATLRTILAEVNVVRRSSRRLVASLLSSYQCFYQRSGSPVWHYDAKKLDQGFDKTKKKFVKK